MGGKRNEVIIHYPLADQSVELTLPPPCICCGRPAEGEPVDLPLTYQIKRWEQGSDGNMSPVDTGRSGEVLIKVPCCADHREVPPIVRRAKVASKAVGALVGLPAGVILVTETPKAGQGVGLLITLTLMSLGVGVGFVLFALVASVTWWLIARFRPVLRGFSLFGQAEHLGIRADVVVEKGDTGFASIKHLLRLRVASPDAAERIRGNHPSTIIVPDEDAD